MSRCDEFLQRADAVEARLAGLAASPLRPGAQTDADPGTGERWDAGHVWAHMAEFVAYWTDQIRAISAAYRGEPVPFGRTRDDEGRIGAITRDRSVAIAVLWSQTLTDIEMLRR